MRPRHRTSVDQAAEGLARVAPLASRWIERLLAMHDPPLTQAQYAALHVVSEGKLVGAELARRAAVSPAAVSQLLGGLEQAGYLERRAVPDDRRRHALGLTERGTEVLSSARSLLSDRLAELLASLPPPKADALGRLLETLEALLTGTPPPPRPPRPHPRPPRGMR